MVVINIDDKLCKGCYYCIEICPKEVLAKSNVLSRKGHLIAKVENIDNCFAYRMCERICPDFAISVHEIETINKN